MLSTVLIGLPGRLVAQVLSAAEVQALLDRHNQARCEVTPAAKVMPELVWDAKLAAVAQRYANQGRFAHNLNRTLDYQSRGGSASYVGENIALGTALSPAEAVALWVAEGRDFNLVTNTCTGTTCGHYTQVVWATTLAVGCGRATATAPFTGMLYVCNYATGGNVVGQAPYATAAPPGFSRWFGWHRARKCTK